MGSKIELLAPGGDVDSIKAAILAGADAIYCGLDKFNARNRATNITFNDLQGILSLAHKNNCEVFLTLNIIVLDSEIPALITLLNKLVNTSIDGVIIQDLGMFYLLSKYFKTLKIHASTQVTTHNQGQIHFLNKLNTTRVNLSRELNINEIKELTTVSHENNILTEVFVHGSYCISFSGLCYISSVHGGNSGNRGRCSQPCRDKYETTAEGNDYPLNLKDNSAFLDLNELANAGVDSLKIEGRIKKFDYVYTIVNSWREQLDSFYNNKKLITDNSDLYKVFNRDFSNSFLKGKISKDMFIDNPRDNSIKHLSDINNYNTNDALTQAQLKLYNEKDEIKASVLNKINKVNINKKPLIISVSGKHGSPLKVLIKTPETSFFILSKANLTKTIQQALDYKMIYKRFKAFDDTEYFIETLELEHLQQKTIIPFKELSSIKKQILFILNNSKENIDPIELPVLEKDNSAQTKPTLSILISSFNDIHLCNNTSANVYFQLPNSFKDRYNEFVNIFVENKSLIPWFPSIIIGNDYNVAVEFLKQVQPKSIVTNNIGIAYQAFKQNIKWIAGPYLNIVNSYSLLSLKENFKCAGSFISNEINKNQIKQIKKPVNFELHYSIYHPIVLMTSRQCFFHQVTGCEKHIIDDTCIQKCAKSSTITNLNKNSFYIEKAKGNYHNIYNENNFLNTDIIADLPNIFSSFFIDLRDIETNTKVNLDKLNTIKLFENYLNGDSNLINELKQNIKPSTNSQYKIGI